MNNKKGKDGKMTIDKLATMVAKGFDSLETRMATKTDISEIKEDVGKLKKNVEGLKEDIKDVRRDILNLGDKFVSYHTFDSLANRVKVLEEKKK